MRKYIDIVTEAFGRRGVTPERPMPSDPHLRSAVEQARQFPNAQAYADAMMADNPSFVRRNTDPQHIHDRWDNTHRQLMMRWENWKGQGYI